MTGPGGVPAPGGRRAPDHRHRPREARHDAVDDKEALVEQELEDDAARGEVRGDPLRTLGSSGATG